MNDEIRRIYDYMNESDLYPAIVPVKYDPMDMALSQAMQTAKRLGEYIAAQPVMFYPNERLFGQLRFDGSVTAALFPRTGHENFGRAAAQLYCKPLDNLNIFEWQHCPPDYEKIIRRGLVGVLSDITSSRAAHSSESQKLDYLDAVETVCNALIARAKKCSDACRKAAETETDERRKAELILASDTLKKVPAQPADTFYEAISTMYFCFDLQPDGLGLLDRILSPYYFRDLERGKITPEEAKRLVQELFLRIQSYTPKNTPNRKKGGECHFVIGGLDETGNDFFNDFSKLLVESLMELPIHCPQLTLRINKKTPRNVLRFVLDCERHDPFKRIAFAGDESRISAMEDVLGLRYSDACRYTVVGCNEPSFAGAVWMGGCTSNIARSLTRTLYDFGEEAEKCADFDSFYALYEKRLAEDVDEIIRTHGAFNRMRARDENVLSAIMLDGPIENALSPTRGGCTMKIGGSDIMGFTCVIDSLTIIKQFVYDEKLVTMKELISALRSDWKNAEDLRAVILKKGAFFGNDSPLSDEIAVRFCDSLYALTKDRRLSFGERILFGTLAGYYAHYATFGALTPATPDGRRAGEPFMVGVGQTAGKDREGLTALLRSVAIVSQKHVMSGPFVCNITLDEKFVKDDEQFEKLVDVLLAYFRMGGLHVQLNYVSPEQLLDAKAHPENYPDMKVRVSGFSGVFVDLGENIQNDVIRRTLESK